MKPSNEQKDHNQLKSKLIIIFTNLNLLDLALQFCLICFVVALTFTLSYYKVKSKTLRPFTKPLTTVCKQNSETFLVGYYHQSKSYFKGLTPIIEPKVMETYLKHIVDNPSQRIVPNIYHYQSNETSSIDFPYEAYIKYSVIVSNNTAITDTYLQQHYYQVYFRFDKDGKISHVNFKLIQ